MQIAPARPRRRRGRGADGPKSGVERRIWKSIKGASTGEPSLAGFGGVVFQGEAKADKSWRQGVAGGTHDRGAGPRCSDVWPRVRSGEPWLGGGGASRKAHLRSADGQRSDSKWGRHECGGFAERRLRVAWSEAGAKAAALRMRGNFNGW